MFEREIKDTQVLKRWSIVRTLMDQSVADHSFCVAMYANDIAVYLDLPKEVHLAVLQYALWHDVDEVFTSDLPGPNKRALMDEQAKQSWDAKVGAWLSRVFDKVYFRRGGHTIHNTDGDLVKAIVKTADWLDAAFQMAMEYQMGNRNAAPAVTHNRQAALASTDKIAELTGNNRNDRLMSNLRARIFRSIDDQLRAHSLGPWLNVEEKPEQMAAQVQYR